MKKYWAGDYLIMTEIIIIGLAASAHLAAVTLGWPFTRCVLLFGGLACIVLFCGICAVLLYRVRRGGKASQKHKGSSLLDRARIGNRAELLAYAVFVLVVLTQLFFICMGDNAYRTGDQTVETTGSFLASDGLYQVNPMTGLPYTEGLPSRLKILCLPTLYGILCRMTGLSPEIMIWKIVPVITLVSCYTAFGLLAAALFGEDGKKAFREKRACFMTVVSLLIWTGASQYGMDGFNLLCSGWRGVTIRNLVFVPWLLSLCLRKKWLSAALCIPAEACIVWTLYGCGACLFFWAGLLLTWMCYGRTIRRRKKRAL